MNDHLTEFQLRPQAAPGSGNPGNTDWTAQGTRSNMFNIAFVAANFGENAVAQCQKQGAENKIHQHQQLASERKNATCGSAQMAISLARGVAEAAPNLSPACAQRLGRQRSVFLK